MYIQHIFQKSNRIFKPHFYKLQNLTFEFKYNFVLSLLPSTAKNICVTFLKSWNTLVDKSILKQRVHFVFLQLMVKTVVTRMTMN